MCVAVPAFWLAVSQLFGVFEAFNCLVVVVEEVVPGHASWAQNFLGTAASVDLVRPEKHWMYLSPCLLLLPYSPPGSLVLVFPS